MKFSRCVCYYIMNIFLLFCKSIIDLVPVHPVDSGCNNYDGSESAILFMGKFTVSYDVIRDYMFHFLEGRLDLSP